MASPESGLIQALLKVQSVQQQTSPQQLPERDKLKRLLLTLFPLLPTGSKNTAQNSNATA